MTKSVEKLIGVQIAKTRNDREITQERLAELIKVTTETISRDVMGDVRSERS